MSFQFLPLYSGDYLRDTRHLSPTAHGIYFLFLIQMWDTKSPLPTDKTELEAICNARSSDEVAAMNNVLAKYFVLMDDGYYNKRMQQEIEKAEILSSKRRQAGKKGFMGKAKKLNQALSKQVLSKCQASAKQVPSNCQASATTPTPTPTINKPLSGKPDHERNVLDEKAKKVINYLNRVTKSKFTYAESNMKLIHKLIKDGRNGHDFVAVINLQHKKWANDPKMSEFLRPKTLFNPQNFENYFGLTHRKLKEEIV